MGSAQEAMACLDTGEAMGYLEGFTMSEAMDRLDHVIAILCKLRK